MPTLDSLEVGCIERRMHITLGSGLGAQGLASCPRPGVRHKLLVRVQHGLKPATYWDIVVPTEYVSNADICCVGGRSHCYWQGNGARPCGCNRLSWHLASMAGLGSKEWSIQHCEPGPGKSQGESATPDPDPNP